MVVNAEAGKGRTQKVVMNVQTKERELGKAGDFITHPQ